MAGHQYPAFIDAVDEPGRIDHETAPPGELPAIPGNARLPTVPKRIVRSSGSRPHCSDRGGTAVYASDMRRPTPGAISTPAVILAKAQCRLFTPTPSRNRFLQRCPKKSN